MDFELFDSFEIEMQHPTKDSTDIGDINKIEQGLTAEHLGVELIPAEAGEMSDSIIGNPEKDMESWHLQDGDMSCAVCCQEFVAEQLLGEEFSEEEFSEFAKKNGWFEAETGTSIDDVGKILESCGLTVDREFGASLNDLAEDLQSGNKPICAVSCGILDNPEYARVPGIRADHAVQVIGIDVSDPNDVKVILNDPGVSEGRGRMISADTFMKAWSKSNNYVATASKEA